MRLFVYPTEKARRAIIVLDCKSVTKGKATVPSHINLDHIQPGMVCCPGTGRQADRSTTYVVAKVIKDGLIFEGAEKGTPDEMPKGPILSDVEGPALSDVEGTEDT